jgi:hypothetical protein
MTKQSVLVAAAVVLALLVVVLAFSLPSHGTAHVTIGMVYEGGPTATATTRHWEPGVIRVFRPDGSFVTSRHLGEGEALSTSLAPGTYRVIGHNGDADCVPKTVVLPAGGDALVPIVCGVM